jgi:hypothetical protein
MAFDENSTIAELVKDPAAKAIFDKHAPGMTSSPMLKMAMSFKLKDVMVHPMSPLKGDKWKPILEDLKAL